MNLPPISLRTVKQIDYPVIPKLLPSLVPDKIVKEHSVLFTAALAHEIRNPLTTIKLAAEMLQSLAPDSDHKVFLDMILNGTGRINDIVTDLLTPLLVKKINTKTHSMHELLDEVLEMSEARILLKGITVCKTYSLEDCDLMFDRPKLKIALTNIIINAVEAMTVGKGELKVVTKFVGKRFIVQIGDNGCGISKENLKNIFKPYFTNKPGGMGLGLAATYDILRSAHVPVHVQSVVGMGTRFDLSFSKNSSSFPVKSVKKVIVLEPGDPITIREAFRVSIGS